MLFQVRIVEKCLAFQMKLNSSGGRIFPPPVLAGWLCSVKDVEYPHHGALCKEQVLSNGPWPLPVIELVLNEIPEENDLLNSTQDQFSRFTPFSSYGEKAPPNPWCCLAQSFYGWRDNVLFWLIFTFLQLFYVLQTGIRLLKCLRIKSVDCLGFHLLLLSKY